MLSRKRKKSLSIARAIKMAKKEETEGNGELHIEIDLDNIEIQSNKHSDNSFDEESPSIGRPRLRYSQQKYKDKMRKEAWDLLKEIAVDEADVEQLLLDILRVYIPNLYEQLSSFSILAENIQSVFESFNEEILSTRKGLLIAAEATKGLKIVLRD